MIKLHSFILLLIFLFTCQNAEKIELNKEILSSLGSKFKIEYELSAKKLQTQIEEDSTNTKALFDLSETQIILYIFGFTSREETIPIAKEAFEKVGKLDSVSSRFYTMQGMLNLLDWDWDAAKLAFQKAIKIDPENFNARHWYSLYWVTMKNIDEAMAQHDTISIYDSNENYLIGKGSILYFARRNEEMKELMLKTIAIDTTVPWGYDWLGMAYVELKEFDNSIETYFKAFELSDGTVEVGAGLGHALGFAGKYKLAKQMADYYTLAAKSKYLPPVQRAFIHIGIGEYDKAIELLEQAYKEHSWFLAFIQIEPWYDPIRNDERFQNIIKRMQFPQ